LKERLDKVLVSKRLVDSREMARALIMEGRVSVDGKKTTKSGTLVNDTSDIILREREMPYVGRGGLKLEAAIRFFEIDVNNAIIMDVGSSTGGFTDCLLKRGAKKVYCIDVGYGQLAWSLRTDPRVIVLERTNARYLDKIVADQKSKFEGGDFKDLINCNIDMATLDVSFISLAKVIPAVIKFLRGEGRVLALVKPQFEVGKGKVGRGGIVREEDKRMEAVKSVKEDLERLGLETIGIFECPITGQDGNVEYFLYMKRGG
jgi:23S rRNA (cytidine1920-2'-O)/16S rRNA (cytidine1409-2'-O)-methyltransferase